MVSVISVMELYQGARSREELRTIGHFFRSHAFRIVPLSEGIGELAAGFVEDYALSDGLQVADALIAATARQIQAVLVTGNVRHFRRIPNMLIRPFRTATS